MGVLELESFGLPLFVSISIAKLKFLEAETYWGDRYWNTDCET